MQQLLNRLYYAHHINVMHTMFSLFFAFTLFTTDAHAAIDSFENDSQVRIAHKMLDSYTQYVLSARALKNDGHKLFMEEKLCVNEASVFYSDKDEKVDLLYLVVKNQEPEVKAIYEKLNSDGIVTVMEYHQYLHPAISGRFSKNNVMISSID